MAQTAKGMNLALISVPGRYAAAEALKALRLGLHVFLFSDNVSVGDELALKQEAERRGLLVMGPDCDTAVLDGAPLGFANELRRGLGRSHRRVGHGPAADRIPRRHLGAA